MMVTATVFTNASLDSVTPAEWDNVSKPKHYNFGKVECIEAIEESMTKEAFKGYLKGNCLKYLWRMDYKGKDLEDLENSIWYLNRLKSVLLKNK